MRRRYLSLFGEEKVYGLYEQTEQTIKFLGRVCINNHGTMIYKDGDQLFLTWEEIEEIISQRPVASQPLK